MTGRVCGCDHAAWTVCWIVTMFASTFALFASTRKIMALRTVVLAGVVLVVNNVVFKAVNGARHDPGQGTGEAAVAVPGDVAVAGAAQAKAWRTGEG